VLDAPTGTASFSGTFADSLTLFVLLNTAAVLTVETVKPARQAVSELIRTKSEFAFGTCAVEPMAVLNSRYDTIGEPSTSFGA